MKVNINNIICHGRFVVKKEPLKERKTKELQFYENTFRLNKKTFTLYICKNIRLLLHDINIKKLLKKRIETEIGSSARVKDLQIKIVNIHHSVTLKLNKYQLITTFLPQIDKISAFNWLDISQESDVFSRTTLKTITEENNLSFLSLKFRCCKRKLTVKVQPNLQDKVVHFTIIASALTPNVQEVIHCFRTFS